MSARPRALIMRLANDAAHAAVLQVMERLPFEFAASIGWRQGFYPSLRADQQYWFRSTDIRGGEYAGVRPEDLLPLDEELVEAMRGCEAVFLHNVARLEVGRSISYERRKRMYYWHLRVWNDFLERQHINILLAGIIPHEIPDHLVYCLCKLKRIPTLIFHATFIEDRAFLFEDIEQSAVQVRERYVALRREYASPPGKSIPLLSPFEEYFQAQAELSGKRAITFRRPTPFDRAVSLIREDVVRALLAFGRWLPTAASPSVWRRRLQKSQEWRRTRALRRFYDRHSVQPDFSQSFLYVPLHYQPECSTSPMAGAFVDQQVMVQLLSDAAPPGVLLYVKEHPKQYWKGFSCRSIAFYEELLSLPNVRLIPHDAPTFALREHCLAVATGTGTAGFEALFRQKPVLLFGHHFYQYAPGVFSVRTSEDCHRAMQAIREGERPDLRDIRLFLKAMEQTTVHASVTDWHQRQASRLGVEQHAKAIAEALWDGMKRYFP